MTLIEFGAVIRGIISNVNEYIGSISEEYGIKYGQFEYFLLIYMEPGINQLELARKKNVGKASVTKAIKLLEDGGYIIRETDTIDKRAFKCFVTEKGKTVAEKLISLSSNMEFSLFANFTDHEKSNFYEYLTRLLINSQNMEVNK